MVEILPARKKESLKIAAELLRRGEIIVLPTDTIYGVAARAFDPDAVAKIYAAKNRPPHKAIPVFVASVADIPRVCREIPAAAQPALQALLPGALTVILPAHPDLPGIITNFGDTVAVRIPDHPPVLELLALLGEPLAVTSANLSDHPTPPTAQGVAAQLDDRVSLVLDDGASPRREPSTILDLTQSPPKILRYGAMPAAKLARFFPLISFQSTDEHR